MPESPAQLYVHIIYSTKCRQGEMKRSSSKWVKTKGSPLAAFQWQSGYGAFSVSSSNVARVRAYISGQDERHKKRTFQDEFRASLWKHGVEFDERYVWD